MQRRARFHLLDLSQEAVALTMNRLNVFRRGGVIAEGGSNLGDTEIQTAIEVDLSAITPKLLDHDVAGYNRSLVPDQEEKELEGLALQFDANIMFAQDETVGYRGSTDRIESLSAWPDVSVSYTLTMSLIF